MNQNVELWRSYRHELKTRSMTGQFTDTVGRYQHTLDELAAIPADSVAQRRAKMVTLVRIAQELQSKATAALVDACYESVATGLTLRGVAREAAVSDVTVLRWVREINELASPFEQTTTRPELGKIIDPAARDTAQSQVEALP
jgi:hypothetical protein